VTHLLTFVTLHTTNKQSITEQCTTHETSAQIHLDTNTNS